MIDINQQLNERREAYAEELAREGYLVSIEYGDTVAINMCQSFVYDDLDNLVGERKSVVSTVEYLS